MKGTIYKVKSKKTEQDLSYLVVRDVDGRCYRLLNLSSLNIISGFKAANSEDVKHYFEENLKVEIISVTRFK